MAENVRKFIAKNHTLAERAAELVDVPGIGATYILSLWGLETGWGKDLAGKYNIAGLKTGGNPNTFKNFEDENDFLSYFVTNFKKLIASKEGNTFFEKVENGAYEGYNRDANVEYAKRLKGAYNTLMKTYIDFNAEYNETTEPIETGDTVEEAKAVSWRGKFWDGVLKVIKPGIDLSPGVDGTELKDYFPQTPDETIKEAPGELFGDSWSWNSIWKNIQEGAVKVGFFLLGVIGVVVGIVILTKSEGGEEEDV